MPKPGDAQGRLDVEVAKEPFVTTDEVAAYLSKPASWVHNNAGPLGLPRYKIGNHYRYLLSEIARWVEGQRR